jgi:hypothetical protein
VAAAPHEGGDRALSPLVQPAAHLHRINNIIITSIIILIVIVIINSIIFIVIVIISSSIIFVVIITSSSSIFIVIIIVSSGGGPSSHAVRQCAPSQSSPTSPHPPPTHVHALRSPSGRRPPRPARSNRRK